MKTLVFLALAAVLFVSTMQAQSANKITKEMYEAADMMVGVFSNREQAAVSNSPLHQEQTIVAKRVMRSDKTSIWIYMAWYQPVNRVTPLDHRLFELRQNEAGGLEVQPYYIAVGTDIARLSVEDLKADVCLCELKALEEGTKFVYGFHTQGENWCESEVEAGMYRYVQMDFRFHDNGFSMFHNFYAYDKSLRFGYPEGSHFKRIEE
jgi:hypothetical protein